MGIRLSKIIDLECFHGAEIIAGHNGLSREVNLVNVMEVPDIFDWIAENELILTTAYPFKSDPSALAVLMEQLHRKKVAGIAIKLNRFLNHLPADVLDCANRLEFPIISLPSTAQFDKIIFEVLSHIISADYKEIKASSNMSRRLQEIAIDGGSLRDVVRTLAEWCGGEVLLKNHLGEVMARSAVTGVHPGTPGCVTYEKHITYDGKLYAVIVLNLWQNTITKSDLEMIDLAVPAIIMMLFQSVIQKSNIRQDESLRDLLLGRMVYSKKNVECLDYMGLDLSKPYTVCVLRGSHRDAFSCEALYGAVAHILNELKGTESIVSAATTMKDSIVHICSIGDSYTLDILKDFYCRLKRELKLSIPSVELSVGISRLIRKPGRVDTRYKEAVQALNLGDKLESFGGIYCYDEMVVKLLLSRLDFEDDTAEFINSEIGMLIEHDRSKDKHLLDTLEQLLLGDSSKDVAERMFLHPKTLAYRKRSIENILGQSIDTANKRVRLTFAITLYRLFSQQMNDFMNR